MLHVRSRIFVGTTNTRAAIKILLKWKMCAQTVAPTASTEHPIYAIARELSGTVWTEWVAFVRTIYGLTLSNTDKK